MRQAAKMLSDWISEVFALRREVRELKRRITKARRILAPWRGVRSSSVNEALKALAAPRKAKR